ncbi:PREDICTED: uncharacterized protein LOC105557628 isoform X2 [Vollenhovia emeryi]|uniref:uncharacterized protein LOC105557628 isoform X2 n=1 Tax=Vollenhovia emeryi TaxID=411798 RepID=UPI0005F437EF|nr:PREDICTED: uncharacterized protein LOC105557628 isoform X2 [Vollenhovia emeryi]
MLRITLLLGAFDIIRCEMQTTRLERTVGEAPSCSNPPLCYLSDTYKTEPRAVSFLPYLNSPNMRKQQVIQRSYYGGFGSSWPAYYHAFDPISVLASLAFLAFLLQSFATLFERSRSILPTIVSGRQSDLGVSEASKHVSHALREYENLNEDLEEK